MPRITDVVALVPAAGRGTRFGGEGSKLSAMVAGATLLDWSLRRLGAAGCSRFVVAVPEGERVLTASLADREDVVLVTGGVSRRDSVRNCLESSGIDPDEPVLVHDAARAAVHPDDVRRVIEAVAAPGPARVEAAVLGRPVADTLKRVAARRIVETVDRRGLWRAETPQVFLRRVLDAGFEAAGEEATDEAMTVEALGTVGIRMIEATRPNPKVTWPGDLEVVAALLASGTGHGPPAESSR